MRKVTGLALLLISMVIVLMPSCTPAASPVTPPRLETVRLVGTIGPLSIPLAYMVENRSLAAVSDNTTLTVWANPTQLQAIISGGQGDFVSLPTSSAAIFFNRGVPLQLLDASIWNILYLVTPDKDIKSIEDLRGKRVVVPYRGAIPDAMFQYVSLNAGINPEKDIDFFYAADPIQASQLLLTGQERYVWLSEPSATSVILRAQAAPGSQLPVLHRALNMKTEWEKAIGGRSSTPIAGTVVLGGMRDRPDVVETFLTEYQKAVQWMLANPVEAGQLGSRVLAEQGFTAEALTESIENIEWNFIRSGESRPDIEAFFQALTEVSPDYIGGKLPGEGFYFNPGTSQGQDLDS